MIRDLEYQFFREYEIDGAAYLSLQYALFKYCGIGSEVPARPDFPDGIMLEIKERTEACQVWPYNGIENSCPLFDEISDNLDSAASDVVRVNYVISILKKLQRWAWLYSLGAEKLSAISNSVEHNSLEYFYWDWLRAFNAFADKLAVALALRGLNLMEIQERCDIKIIDNLDVDRLWMDFGTPAMAEYYLSSLKPSKPVTMVELLKDLGLATEKALKYIPIAVERGLIERTGDMFLWKGESKVLFELFFGMIYCGDDIKPSRRFRDEWHLGVKDLPNAALSRLFPGIKNIGQQRVNNLITPHRDVRYRTAPKGWEAIKKIFE